MQLRPEDYWYRSEREIDIQGGLPLISNVPGWKHLEATNTKND